MTTQEIESLGNEIASLYGAICTGYERNETNDGYYFCCNEYGDEFYCEMKDKDVETFLTI